MEIKINTFKKFISKEDWFNEMLQRYWKSNKTNCPFCGHKLIKKYEGLVCQYRPCLLGCFKLGKGWVYLNRKKENSLQYFHDEYDFDINSFENKKKWLLLKIEVFNERGRSCEICSSIFSLHVHHIIYRTEDPLLSFDKENLMVLCEKCHKKIHEGDKYKFD